MKTARSILSTIKSWKRGKVFFYSDFEEAYGTDAIRQQLSRLCRSGEIVRCGAGIFYYPEIDTVYGFGMIPPTNGIIARAYADKFGLTLMPTKEAAMNMIGLSTQNQMNTVYLTDGRSRKINTGIGRGISLVHTSQTRLKLFRSKEMQMLAIALHGERLEEYSEYDMRLIGNMLHKVSDKDYEHDVRLLSFDKQNFLRKCRSRIS